MQWVEGLTLNQFVGPNADKPATLEALLADLGAHGPAAARRPTSAHGDLQHGNVLLVPGAGANSLALKLVDYDGMWVPALAGTQVGRGGPSRRTSIRSGCARGRTACEVDRFPLLLDRHGPGGAEVGRAGAVGEVRQRRQPAVHAGRPGWAEQVAAVLRTAEGGGCGCAAGWRRG